MLRLRPYKKCDAKHIISWIQDEKTFYQWCAGKYDHYPITAEDINQQYEAYANDDHFYEMTAFDESGVVGHMIMRFLDKEKTILRFGFVIVDHTKRKRGYGQEMIRLAFHYAFTILKVSKVTIGVFENNPQAFSCYQSVGFREVRNRETEHYQIMGEDWKCRELEVTSEEWNEESVLGEIEHKRLL